MRCVDCSGLMCTQEDPNNSAGLTHAKESSTRQAHGRVELKVEESCSDLISPATLERKSPRGATTWKKKSLWTGQ